jgi:hypothetical protein
MRNTENRKKGLLGPLTNKKYRRFDPRVSHPGIFSVRVTRLPF